MSNMFVTKTKIYMVSAALVCVVCVAAYGLAVYALNRLSDSLTDEQKHVATMQAQIQSKSTLIKNSEGVEIDRQELQKYFIAEEEVFNFLELIEALGQARGALVSTASIDVEEGDGYIESLHLTIKASGSFGAVQHVLTMLETLPYKSHVSSSVIEKKGAVESDGEWEGTFKVVVMKRVAI